MAVTLSGYGPEGFASYPPATEWSTFDTLTGAAGTYTSPAALDAAAVLLDSTTYTTALSGVLNTGTSRLGRYSTNGTYVFTQPTGVPYSILLARLRNTSGGGVSSITVGYNYTIPVAPVTDECPGQRVFYSQTGLPNSWTLIPEFSGITAAGALSATLALGSWPDNGDLFIMFLDDNNLTGADGAFAIDNFTVSGVVPLNLTAITITNSPANLTVSERAPATFTVVAGGAPRDYHWFSNNVPVPGNNSATFTIPSAAYPANNGAQIYVVVSNALGAVTSSTATLTVQPDIIAPTIVRVVGNSDLATVSILFSEDILPSGVDPANFTLFPTGSDPEFDYLLTTGAVLTSPSNVVITTDLRIAGTNYSIRIQEIRDNSSQQNVIDPNPTDIAFITQNVALIDLTDNNLWKFGTLSNTVADVTYNPALELSIPAGWETVAYDDSTWPEAAGPLGLDASAGTGNQPALNTTITYSARSEPTFFRRHFDLPALTNGLVLTLRHYFEDGAVVYINGVDSYRSSVAPATDPNNPVARASATGVEGGGLVTVTLPLSNIVAGDNVIAVAVLQSGGTSSDVEMALELTASIPQYPSGPVVINTQPAALTTVNEGSPFTLGVGASGAIPITYQWRKGGVAIPGANGPTYSVASAVPSDEATYTVAITNAINGLISSAAFVDVIPDNAAPTILSAIGSTNLNVVVLTLNDVGRGINLAAANNPANYNVHLRAGGPNLGIASVVAANVGTNTVVTITTTAARVAGENYTVSTTGITDQSAAANPLTPSSYDITATYVVFGFAQVWRYNETGTDLGSTWKDVGFNDSAWPSGAGFLAFETSAGPLTLFTNLAGGNGSNTVLSLTNNTLAGIDGTNITFYFRTTVASLPFDPNAVGNSLRGVSYFDDGGVIYVNGSEAMRFNLTNSPTALNYTNLAVAGSTEGAGGLITSNLTGFVSGNNIIAAEVHQNSVNSSDIAWGMQLEASVLTFIPVVSCPTLHISQDAGTGQITLSWTGAATLEETTALQTPSASTVWGPSARVNGVPFTPSGARYYRLTCP